MQFFRQIGPAEDDTLLQGPLQHQYWGRMCDNRDHEFHWFRPIPAVVYRGEANPKFGRSQEPGQEVVRTGHPGQLVLSSWTLNARKKMLRDIDINIQSPTSTRG